MRCSEINNMKKDVYFKKTVCDNPNRINIDYNF